MKYQVEIWCPACWGDDEGCFEGGSVYKDFYKKENAEEYALNQTDSTIYKFKITEKLT